MQRPSRRDDDDDDDGGPFVGGAGAGDRVSSREATCSCILYGVATSEEIERCKRLVDGYGIWMGAIYAG